MPTHLIAADTEYYTTGPQQGRPPDGMVKTGTRVQFVKAGGSYSQVKTDTGLVAFVAANALTKVLGKEAITPDVRNVATSINGFAFDLYGQLAKKEGNLFCSPASISAALAMTYAGAGGDTEKEMGHVLHFDRNPTQLPVARFHEAYGRLTSLLNSGGGQGGYVLRTANRLWGQESYEFLPDYLKITREQYGAELAELDFQQTEAARREINEWVEQQTQQKIKDLIPSGVLRDDARLVLTNAIYFLGGWDEEFSETATQNQPFFVTSQQTVEVPLMTQTERFRHAESDDVQVLEMPYRGHEISMVVLLPKTRDGLAGLEGKLTADHTQKWIASLRSRKVQVFLPKFKMTSQFALKDALSAMGMPTPFTEAADFSKMASSERLMISEVVHKAFVDVNEKGTEAAAATAVLIAPTSALVEPEEPATFRADHPFVFLLRDNRSGAVLFLGRVSNPKL
jgi:serpin B